MDDAFAKFMADRFRYLIDKIDSQYFTDFFCRQKLDEALLNKLKRSMLIIHQVLVDNEHKRWFRHLGEVTLDLESLLDDAVAAAESLLLSFGAKSQPNTNQTGSSISREFTSLGKSKDQYHQQMESIAEKFEFIVKESLQTTSKHYLQLPAATDCSNDEFEVIGRNADKEAIIELLLADNVSADQIDVIAIMGTCGVGKTTLARLVYDDNRVNDHFDLKVWICVPEDFDVFGLTKTILEALVTSQLSDVEDLNSLQARLKEVLNTKKFLLVLDNFGYVNHYNWETLRSNLSAGANGTNKSKIIVATGISELVAMSGTVYAYHLKTLTYEDSWMLFAKYAYADENSSLHPQLEEIGKEIVKSKCFGFPLVAKVVGAALSFKARFKEWDTVLKSGLFDLPDDTSSIPSALMLSYGYLPTHLKLCFAACKILPRGYEFEEEEVIRIWMAAGPLQRWEHKSMEEVGHEYFLDLTSRCFFQRSSANRSRFVMHDLLHHFAHFVTGDATSRLGHGHEYFLDLTSRCFFQQLSANRLRSAMHDLGLDLAHSVSGDATSRLRHGPHGRSLVVPIKSRNRRGLSFSYVRRHQNLTPSPRLTEFPYLARRLLDLSDCFLPIAVLADSVGRLKNFTKLPDSIGRFIRTQDLELLCLSHGYITELPEWIGRLRNLRYLDLSHTVITRLPGSVGALFKLETLILSNCSSLTELPATTRKLINLQHLLIDGTGLKEMPKDMGRLTNLQTLSNFIVGKSGGYGRSQVKELGSLSNLRGTLHISELQNVVFATDASKANLKC